MSYCHTVAQKYASDGIYHCIRIVHFLYLEATAFDYFLLCFALLALSTSSYVWLTLNLQMAHSHFHKSHTIFTSLTALLWAGLSSLYQMMVAGEDTPESYLKDGVE